MRMPVMSKRLLVQLGRRNGFASTKNLAFSTKTVPGTDPYVSGDSTHFGYENVKVDEKEGRVRQVFENVAESYDVMNDLMSGKLRCHSS